MMGDQRACLVHCTDIAPKPLPKDHSRSAGTSSVSGHFYAVAQSLLPGGASLLATAELFARLGAAQFDANVVGWYLKYYYLFWRPVSAIR